MPRVRTARWLLLGLLALTVAWLAVVSNIRVIGMGHVRSEDIALSPIFEGRIDSMAVTCNDRVSAGQVLAVISNPIRAHTYREELAELESAARARRVVHDQRIAVGIAELDSVRRWQEVDRRHEEIVAALATATERAWQAHAATLKDRVAAMNALSTARARTAAAQALLRRRAAELERLRVDEDMQMRGFEERLAAMRTRAGLGGAYEIRAPFDGTITDCPRDIGAIVRPSVAVLRMQRAASARIFVWVPALDVPRLEIGMPVDVVLTDSGRHVAATVHSAPVEVGSLPSSLKRYFWQNQAWQQYARIELAPDDPREGAALADGTRVDAVIRTTELLRIPLRLLASL